MAGGARLNRPYQYVKEPFPRASKGARAFKQTYIVYRWLHVNDFVPDFAKPGRCIAPGARRRPKRPRELLAKRVGRHSIGM